MLKSQYHSVVIGRNYLSFIISLLLANKDQSLLMIDDERVRYGENWHRNIGEFEKNTLQSIGEAFEVEPLKNINKYLSPSPFYLKLGNRHVKLGDTPFENLREIARKIPECFTKKVHSIFNESNRKDFNRTAEIYFNQLADACFRLKKTSQFDDGIIDKALNNNIRMVLEDFVIKFENPLNEKEHFLVRQFLYVLQGKFQFLFSDTYSKAESKFLISQALSQRYILDEEKLNTDLETELLSKNGVIKRTSIQYWQFYQKRLSSVLLSSYEGVIHSDRTYFVGNLFPSLPFHLDTDDKKFTDMILTLDYGEPLFSHYQSQKMLVTDPERIGSDYPMWEVDFISNSSCIIRYLYPLQPGTKPEFFLERARKDISETFLELFVDFTPEKIQDSLKISAGTDLWSERLQFSAGKTDNNSFQKLFQQSQLKVRETKTKEYIKDFEYWGPLQVNPLGLFSFLLDIKNSYL